MYQTVIKFGLTFAASLAASLYVSANDHHQNPQYHVAATWANVGPTPHFSAVDGRLHKVFVSNLANGTVTVMNTITGMPIDTIKLGGTVHTVMLDPKTQRVYVTDLARGYLDVINAKTDQVLAEIPVGAHLHGLAVSNQLHMAFVTDVAQSKVYAVDTRTNMVLTPGGIPVGPNPWGVAVNPRTKTLYVADTGVDPFSSTTPMNPAGNSVSVINLRTMQVVRTIPVGPHPWNLVVNRKSHTVYAGIMGAHEVAVIRHNRVIQDIPVGLSPHGMALDPKNHRLFVNNTMSNTTSVINTKENRVINTLAVGKQPAGISVNPKNGLVYAVNGASQSISVLAPNHSEDQ